MLRKALLLLALVLICSGTALAQVGGIQAQQTASNPLQLRITDGDVTSTLGTYTFKATNVLLTASATNYVYLDLTTTPPTLTVNTTGFPTSNYYAIATVTTNSKQITAMTDSRPSFNSAAFSGGGSSGSGPALTPPTGTESGVVNAYVATVAFPAGITATSKGAQFYLTPNNTNTGASTINVNGSGVVSLFQNGVALTSGLFATGNVYLLGYDGTQWEIEASGTVGQTAPLGLTQILSGIAVGNPPQGGIRLFTPFYTDNLQANRSMIQLVCIGSVASGCSTHPTLGLGFDSDGVAIIQAPVQGALLGTWEIFSPFQVTGLQPGSVNNAVQYLEAGGAATECQGSSVAEDVCGGFGSGIFAQELVERSRFGASQIIMNGEKGKCVFAASTTCSITYATAGHAFTNTPLGPFLTPENPGAVTFTVTSQSNTGFTITASASNSLTVDWIAIANPN